MQCPIDQTELVMTERQGVEIDYCPKCRGVWLDRGELDKIIERANAALSPSDSYTGQEWATKTVGGMSGKVRPMTMQDQHSGAESPAGDSGGDADDADPEDRRSRKMGRRSFLEEIFDFGQPG